jgi:hypothetical protein
MCFFINALNNKTIHLKYRQVKVKYYFLKMYQCEGCGCLALIRTLNCGVVFDKETRMSCWTSNQFQFFVLTATSVENLDSQRYIVANGIKSFHSSLYKARIGFSQGTPEFSKAF